MRVINFILATAGHVDHGKSALVTALTGTDPDRLPEEKARGITIELGFAHLDLPARDGRTLRVGVVDVPGHEDFVKNMVAGVGSIDAAMLVVAADDGWMPQTEEHLQILEYLGVSRAVVALTKIDLIADDAAPRKQILERLSDSPLRDAPIISTSIRTNRGLENLKVAIAEMLETALPPRDIGKPRLALDRAFALRGIGTVVTGTLAGGELRRGQNVIVQPARIATRIRNIQSHNEDIEVARPGSRVALHLADLEPRSDDSAHGDRVVGRGDVITIESLGHAIDLIDVVLFRSRRAPARALKSGAVVQIHHGTRATGARVQLMRDQAILPAQESVARLRLTSPIFAFVGDRFVIRDWSEQQTLAGGIVLDVNPPRRFDGAISSSRVDQLVLSSIERSKVVDRAGFLSQSNFSAGEIDRAIEQLINSSEMAAIDSKIVLKRFWESESANAIAAIDEHHRAHPDQPGIGIADLRARVDRSIFEPILAELCAKGFVQRGTSLARATHSVSLPAHLTDAGEAIRKALSAQPFDPPSRAQLAATPVAYHALKFLLSNGEAIEISKEIVMSSKAFIDAINRIQNHLRANRSATVSELKTILDSSRRIMVPLLEKLDRDGITRRVGDRRELK